MNQPFQTTLFTELTEKSRIPASPVRVVALWRSTNMQEYTFKDGHRRLARAHIVVLYTLRGSYSSFCFMQHIGSEGGTLFAGPETPVVQYEELEKTTLEWVTEQGFEVQNIALSPLDFRGRLEALASLPFAHSSSADPTQGTLQEEATARVFEDLEPLEAFKRLRAFVLLG